VNDVPVFRRGKLICAPPSLDQARECTQQQLAMLYPGIKRSITPHQYPAGLELGLHKLKTSLVLQSRGER